MGVIYDAPTRTDRLNKVKDAIDSGGAAGTLEIGTSGMSTVLAVLTLSYPCGTVSGDVLTLGTITADSSADAGGTAAAARIKDSTGTVRVQGLTVGGTAEGTAAGKNVVLNSSTIAVGQNVSITSAAITHNTSGT